VQVQRPNSEHNLISDFSSIVIFLRANVAKRSRRRRFAPYRLSFRRQISRYASITVFHLHISWFKCSISKNGALNLCFADAGATVTFLLRSAATFDNDETIQAYVKSGKAQLIQGDGLVIEDVRKVWVEASKERPVDVLLFTVGYSEYLFYRYAQISQSY